MRRALVVALLCTATAAVAEPQIGSRLGDRVERFHSRSDADAVRSGHEMANCAFAKRPSMVRAYLDARDAASADKVAANLGRDVQCQNLTKMSAFADGQAVHQPQDIYRGMLAEAVVTTMDVSKFGAMPVEQSYPRDWFVLTGRDPSVDEMAVCVAEIDPVGVRALLGTTSQTSEEAAAIGRINAALGTCLRVNATLKANRQSLRAALAEALYHRAVSPVSVAAAK